MKKYNYSPILILFILLSTIILMSMTFCTECSAYKVEKDGVVAGRKVEFLYDIYAYNVEESRSLKDENKGLPKGIAIAPDGKVFVIFLDRMKIQVFTNDGRFRFEFGEKGTGEGKYILPLSIKISGENEVFLLDAKQRKVLAYDSRGRFLSEFFIDSKSVIDKPLDLGDEIITASKMGLDRNNKLLYIADNTNCVIRRFTLDGGYVDKFGGKGDEQGKFIFPGSIAFDKASNIYALDMANARVQVFDLKKNFKFSFGKFGDLLGQFARPNAICIDSKGRIYVLDRLLSVIQVFDSKGTVLGVIKDLKERDELKHAAPFDMAIDENDHIFISAQDYNTIKVIKDLE